MTATLIKNWSRLVVGLFYAFGIAVLPRSDTHT